ncbi:MAG TPA: DUF6691 family protein [Candidatus Krumholzibacteria bacterium]|nr:DUF6691 family protein [Candidatus Krumholzibacteria bacterium]
MIKNVMFLLIGIVFGVTLYKAEIISWYRIQEMFRFHAFHMYGVLGSAVAVAMISVAILSRSARREGAAIARRPFQHGVWIGGLIFGMGWALTGACPGPLWVHVGAGTEVMLIAIASALVGVLAYSFIDPKLPH